VLLLPCGRSAHLEAGYVAARGADTFVLAEEPCEPELMYGLMRGIVCSVEELLVGIAELEGNGGKPRVPSPLQLHTGPR
jgi:hypothetical protein